LVDCDYGQEPDRSIEVVDKRLYRKEREGGSKGAKVDWLKLSDGSELRAASCEGIDDELGLPLQLSLLCCRWKCGRGSADPVRKMLQVWCGCGRAAIFKHLPAHCRIPRRDRSLPR